MPGTDLAYLLRFHTVLTRRAVPGVGELELKVNAKTVKGDFIVDKDGKGKYMFGGRTFGDALSFTLAMIKR
eukprot:3223904-Rhodomonas_salina.8